MHTRLLLPLWLAAALVGLTTAAVAQGTASRDGAAATVRSTVVELFTSQGCSSCPTADALLAKLATRVDVLALSFPVDYWDYLGWKDTLANPKFTERQKAYKSALGVSMIYTPMMVVGGLTQVNGSDEDKVLLAIEKSARIVAATRVPTAHRRQGWSPRDRGWSGEADWASEGRNALAGVDRQECRGPDRTWREPRQDRHLLQRRSRADPRWHVERRAR